MKEWNEKYVRLEITVLEYEDGRSPRREMWWVQGDPRRFKTWPQKVRESEAARMKREWALDAATDITGLARRYDGTEFTMSTKPAIEPVPLSELIAVTHKGDMKRAAEFAEKVEAAPKRPKPDIEAAARIREMQEIQNSLLQGNRNSSARDFLARQQFIASAMPPPTMTATGINFVRGW